MGEAADGFQKVGQAFAHLCRSFPSHYVAVRTMKRMEGSLPRFELTVERPDGLQVRYVLLSDEIGSNQMHFAQYLETMSQWFAMQFEYGDRQKAEEQAAANEK